MSCKAPDYLYLPKKIKGNPQGIYLYKYMYKGTSPVIRHASYNIYIYIYIYNYVRIYIILYAHIIIILGM